MGYKKRDSSLGLLVVLAVIVGLVGFVSFSPMFERDIPVVSMDGYNGYWNLKKPLKISIKDNSGIKAYRIIIRTSRGERVVEDEQLLVPIKNVELNIKPPRGSYTVKDREIGVVVQAIDKSYWNFFSGNVANKIFKFTVDRKRPRISIINNSYKISKGGCALVIFKVQDVNLEDVYIESNHKKHFKAQPFYKEGYYIALLAWPIKDNSFRAHVVAIDIASNTSRAYVPLYLKDKPYRVSSIKLRDKFLNGKIADLADDFDETQGVEDRLERFKIINEDVRAKNEALIHKITSVVPDEMISDFNIKRMHPLKNAKVVARFGDHRKYYYDGKFISEAYHLGLDLASHAQAPILSQNGGKVVFADFNGLYGNSPIISHGLGLYTLYGHCSSLDVSVGDEIAPNTKIANTGKSGYAMGDHLHFGVLVQGIEVRPQEWMDKEWIKLNITDIIRSAKEIIDQE